MGRHYQEAEKGFIYGQLSAKIPLRRIIKHFFDEFGY